MASLPTLPPGENLDKKLLVKSLSLMGKKKHGVLWDNALVN